MTRRPRCPQCRGPLRPGGGLVYGAWYCVTCRSAFTQDQVERASKQPGDVVPGPWRR